MEALACNDALRTMWEQELTDMRQRIQRMRQLFVNTLQEKGAEQDFSFITQQNGMFSFSGLSKEQVGRLREEFAVYAVNSGRVNVAGMTPDNMAPLCEAIVAVLKGRYLMPKRAGAPGVFGRMRRCSGPNAPWPQRPQPA